MIKNITWLIGINCIALLPITTDYSMRLVHKYNVPFLVLMGCGILVSLFFLFLANNTNYILTKDGLNFSIFDVKNSLNKELTSICATASLLTYILTSSLMSIYIAYCLETFLNLGFEKILTLSICVLFIASILTYRKFKFNLTFIISVSCIVFSITIYLVIHFIFKNSYIDLTLHTNFIGSFVIYKLLACLVVCSIAFDPFRFKLLENNNNRNIYIIAIIMGVICLSLLYIERFAVIDLKDYVESVLLIKDYNIINNIFENIANLFILIIMFIFVCSNMNWFVSYTEILSKEKFLPTIFKNVNDRFMYSISIIITFIFSTIIIIISKGRIDAILNVLPVTIFTYISILYFSYYKKIKVKKYKIFNLVISSVGLILLIPYIILNIRYGTWLVLLSILVLSIFMLHIHRYYISLDKSLKFDKKSLLKKSGRSYSLIVLSYFNKGVLPAVNYAKAISNDCRALYITDDYSNEEELFENWEYYFPDIPFVTIKNTKNKNIIRPILDYINYSKKSIGSNVITVVLPEYVPKKPYHAFLHRNYAFFLRLILGFKKGIITTTVPYWSE